MPIFKPQTFNEAFAQNRKLGRKTFTWKGKKYHTKTKEEVEAGNTPIPPGREPRREGDPMHGPHRRGGSIPRYQSRGETDQTSQGELASGDTVPNPSQQEMMQYGMNQSGPQGGAMRSVQQGPGGNIPQNMQQAAMNQIAQYQQQLHQQKQQQFQMMLQELQVKNQQLEQQNQLLNTKIQKDEMINNARTIPSNLQKAITSPKKRGGSNNSKRMGGAMKKGGSCGLPGGRMDMRKRRR